MSTVGTVQCPILVGRDDLLGLADRLIADAKAGHGRTLFLSGQAGLGKTRLMRAVLRKAAAAGFRITSGSVAPQDHQVPLASIRELITGLRDDPNWDPGLRDDLLAVDGQHDGDALGARRLMVRSISDRLVEAIDRPTVVAFADLHWTDEMSLEVIGELARHAAERQLLIIADYRADEFPSDTIHREWRSRLLSQRHAEEVKLRRLTPEETGIATTLILGGDLPAPSDVVAAVFRRTNGIPLHIEELLAALEPADRAEGRRILEAHVPDTIGDAVLARLGRLSEDAQMLARAGAVVGRCFSPDVIAGVAGRTLSELEPSIQELVDAAILYPFDYIDEGYFDFRHQLLRDAIYGAMPQSQLRKYHAQAAEFVMSLEASSIVHASRHYERAGLRPQAFRASLTAADEAMRISARQEAYELYGRAIANLPADLPILEQAELYERYADSAAAIERNEESAAASIKARALYLEGGRPLNAAAELINLSNVAGRTGAPHPEWRALVDQALAELEALPVTPEREKLRAFMLGAAASARFFASDLIAAREIAQQARDVAESMEDRATVLEVDLLLARIDVVSGRYESGLRDGMRAAREARDSGFESVGVTGYRNLAVVAARVMDRAAAEVAIGEGLEYADAIEQSHCRQMMQTTLAILEWGTGDWDAADRRARQELVDRGCVRGAVGSEDVLGLVALGRGRPDEARSWLNKSLEAGRRMGEVQFILTPLWGLAEADLIAGDAQSAAERCDEGWSIARTTGERALFIPFVVTGTKALIATRRPDDAERWVRSAREHLAGWESVAGPALSHAEGLVRFSAGSLTAARENLERAVRGWEERGRTWESLNAGLDLVACLLRMNRHADAAEILAQVHDRAASLSSGPLAARADELARASRGRGLEDEPWRPLTVREFEVARKIAEGLTNAQIATELFVSPKTVSAHVEHILAKLGVARRAEIAAWTATVTRAETPTPKPEAQAAIAQ
jgi:DNA-binding CsgD family transcriptional regulator